MTSGNCIHDWVISEGHRGKYWCSRCPATGARRMGQWAGEIKAHARPHPEFRPTAAPAALPHNKPGFEDAPPHLKGRVMPKPRSS
jgi:hypothetical protein